MMCQENSYQLPLLLRVAVFLMLVFPFSPDASGDEVVIMDGSRLNGEVVRQDAEVLRLKTTFAGTISIEWDQVAELVLTEPVTIILDDEQVLNIAAISREGDRFVLYPVSSSTPVTVNASRVKVIEPDPWEMGTGHKLTGNINISVKNEKGNSEKNEFDLDFKLNNRWRKNNLLVMGDLEYDTTRGIRSTDNWTVKDDFYDQADEKFWGPAWYLDYDQFV